MPSVGVDEPGSRETESPTPSSTWAWQSSGPRDQRLDLLRGLFVLKMVFDHFWSTPFHAYADWIGYVTAAEGFFLLSGTMVGIVYGRRAAQSGIGPVTTRLWKRAIFLFAANFLVMLLMIGAEYVDLTGQTHYHRMFRDGLRLEPFLRMDHPYFLQLLPRYAVYLGIAPLALWLLLRGRTALLLVGVLTIYTWNVLERGGLHLPYVERSFASFPVLTWQLPFFIGLICGFHRTKLSLIRDRLGARRLVLFCALAALGFVAMRWYVRTGRLPMDGETLEFLVSRNYLGPLRVLNVAVVFGLLFAVVHRAWVPISAATGWILLPFGRRALLAFLLHIPLAWVAIPVIDRWLAVEADAGFLRLALNLVLILLLLLMLRLREGIAARGGGDVKGKGETVTCG